MGVGPIYNGWKKSYNTGKMKTPRYSIIIPTLNEEKFLPNLLQSIADQTEKLFEVIVVDGASKDDTIKIARSFDKKIPIRVIGCDHARLPMQRNKGAIQAKGEWFLFVDADSVLLPYCMKRLDAFIRSGVSQLVTAWGKPDSTVNQDSLSTLFYNMTLEGGLLFKRPIAPGPFTAVSRKAFESIRGFDESLEFGEDQNLSQRLADRGVSLSILRETLYVWSMRRFRAKGMLRSSQVYIKAALRVLFTGKNYTRVPGYIMGGQVYTAKHTSRKRSVLKTFEMKFKKMMGEVFG